MVNDFRFFRWPNFFNIFPWVLGVLKTNPSQVTSHLSLRARVWDLRCHLRGRRFGKGRMGCLEEIARTVSVVVMGSPRKFIGAMEWGKGHLEGERNAYFKGVIETMATIHVSKSWDDPSTRHPWKFGDSELGNPLFSGFMFNFRG